MDRRSAHDLLLALGFEAAPESVPERGITGHPTGQGMGFRVELPTGVERELIRVTAVGTRPGGRAWLVEVEDSPTASLLRHITRSLTERRPAEQHLVLAAGTGYTRLMIAWMDATGALRHLAFAADDLRATDIEVIADLAAPETPGAAGLAACYARALDRTRVGRSFFEDFRAQRDVIAAAWTGLPAQARADREQLALLCLSRLMFLYFLQRRGHLSRDPAYLRNLFDSAAASARGAAPTEPSGAEAPRRAPTRSGLARARSLYGSVVKSLFFGALNKRPAERSSRARALGDLPYLNGGLFERHALEGRYPQLDLPDGVVLEIFDRLLERYRFTTRDRAETVAEGSLDAAIDPEMLGRVFEGVMAADRRVDTGTYYTPARVVDRVVSSALTSFVQRACGMPRAAAAMIVEGLDVSALDVEQRVRLGRALANVRVLDPACGSGAFLLGALSRLTRLMSRLEPLSEAELRRRIVGTCLHGVDVEPDAALLCALRLWLALIDDGAEPGKVQPLPNLDRNIRQGDALIDPLDFTAAQGPTLDARAARDRRVRRAIQSLEPAARLYLTAGPNERPELARRLSRQERALAIAWIQALDQRLAHRSAELGAEGATTDLWGELTDGAKRAARTRSALERRRASLVRIERAIRDTGAIPFFSFRVHFADATAAGFDLVISNPPWVRAHRWPASLGPMVREGFAVCRDPTWRADIGGGRSPAGGQVDLALLFLERAIRLLACGGVAALLLPAKAFRAMYGGAARRLLIEQTVLLAIEDHALDQGSIFKADAFAGIIEARKLDGAGLDARNDGPFETDGRAQPVRITLARRSARALHFETRPADLPLDPSDPASPWLLVPPSVRAALRCMQRAGPPLGAGHGLRVRRGLLTGANGVLLVREAERKLGGLAHIKAEGWFGRHRSVQRSRYEGVVEADALRPIVRGAGIRAWRYQPGGHVVWAPDVADDGGDPAPRLAAYLDGHRARLTRRSGVRAHAPLGALLRVNDDLFRCKVAWHDLAANLNAVALPANVQSLGARRPLLPLNTVYYIATPNEEQAQLLACYLNALPVRTFARSIAERAKDARFRFFAWTIACIPLPAHWASPRNASWLSHFARDAHKAGGVSESAQRELDQRVAALYRLTGDDMAAIRRFDYWLRGKE